MLKDKNIVLGVTGGIAAYKSATLAHALYKLGANVQVIMTKNAAEFVTPLTFETLTQNKCLIDTFDRNFRYDVTHISVAKAADLIIVAPATADYIAKAANGIADDMLTTVTLAAQCPKMVAPAMNTAMYENRITQDNLKKLRSYGFEIIEPASGLLACGDTGSGKMPEPEELVDCVIRRIAYEHDLQDMKVLVTAGPTQEDIDPVRFITNHSTGRMGYEIARACSYRGADVRLVTGPTAIEPPRFVDVFRFRTSAEMHDAVIESAPICEMLFMAAAVADYTPAIKYDNKVKKKNSGWNIELDRTADILGDIKGMRREDQVICGFSMETENMIENSRSKLARKNLDMICANSLRTEGAGFGGDTNVVTMITADTEEALGKMSKFDTAMRIIDRALELREKKRRYRD